MVRVRDAEGVMVDASATSPGLLRRLGNWRDDAAWAEFVAR
jgi:hypothetical protein